MSATAHRLACAPQTRGSGLAIPASLASASATGPGVRYSPPGGVAHHVPLARPQPAPGLVKPPIPARQVARSSVAGAGQRENPPSASAQPLGKTSECSSTMALQGARKVPRRRPQTEAERNDAIEKTGRERWRLQGTASKLLHFDATRRKSARVCYCCKTIRAGQPGVSCVYVPEKQAGYLGGLMRCESVWLCPVCAATITEDRRRELQLGLRLARAMGLKPVLLTFTFRHHNHQQLRYLRQKLMKALGRLKAGREAKERNKTYGKAGEISSREVTWGMSNGWHPHVHEIWLLAADADVEAFAEELRAAWKEAAAKEGLSMNEHGFDCQETDEEVGNYVAKWGEWSVSSELTKWHTKKGRADASGELRLTPFDLLRQAADGDQEAAALFREYAAASKGWRQLYWSRGLRELLGLTQEKTEAEIIAEHEEEGVILDVVTPDEYLYVLKNDARHELVEATRSGDPRNIWALLEALGARGPAGQAGGGVILRGSEEDRGGQET
jgi:hypothetical protein